jgi:hypothetical protein
VQPAWRHKHCRIQQLQHPIHLLIAAIPTLSVSGQHNHDLCLLLVTWQVEHQRRLRQLAEAEAELTAQQLQLQAERQAVAAAAGRQALQEEAQAQAAR